MKENWESVKEVRIMKPPGPLPTSKASTTFPRIYYPATLPLVLT
jgi:hypothetical protein